MEKKRTIITVAAVLTIFLGIAAYFILNGMVAMDGNYVFVEINPKIEFVTNRSYVVTSYKPINKEAQELVIQ